MPEPLISVVIPVKNGDAWLDGTLRAIYGQSLAAQLEVLVIDSGSTDDTFNILARYPVKILHIEPSTFNHGAVRNFGAANAKGQYIVMTVQDAEAADNKWLEKLLEGFDDENVAGVCGSQIVPHDKDKNPVDWYRPISMPARKKYHFKDAGVIAGLSKNELKNICSWDNVNAMYRKDILLQVPFQAVSFAEDALWAKDVLNKGYSIVYNPTAKVKHYHFETPEFTFRRSLTVHYHFYRFFGITPERRGNSIIQLSKNIKVLLKETQLQWKDKWKWIAFNYNQRKASVKAANAFYKALMAGEDALEKLHSDICKRAPQALKPQSRLR